jgi:hypothetical protein
MMPKTDTVTEYCVRSLAFMLYADAKAGVSLSKLAEDCGRSELWVKERIEAARLCFEKQVRLETV